MKPDCFKRIDDLIKNAFHDTHHIRGDWNELVAWMDDKPSATTEKFSAALTGILTKEPQFKTRDAFRFAVLEKEVGEIAVFVATPAVGDTVNSLMWIATTADAEKLLFVQIVDVDSDESAPRLNLRCCISCLEMMLETVPKKITFYASGEYLNKGLRVWLRAWRSKGWTTRDGGSVKNEDLWRKINTLLGIVEDMHIVGLDTKTFSRDKLELCREITNAGKL